MAVALTFLISQKVIQVDSPQTSVTIQDLINQIRNFEQQLTNLIYKSLANASGKQSLGGGSSIGITLELIDDWRLSFEARAGPSTTLCTVSGGNLVATNQYNNNPIYPTAFTQVVISQSSSPTIIQADTDYATLYLLESLRGRNRSIGTVYYWNPTSGNDSNDGLTPAKAVATFNKAHTLATAGAGDIIFAVGSASGGITTSTEKLTISKAGLKVRGPGYQFQLVPSTSGAATVAITGDSVEFEGFYVKTAAGGADNGITVTGDNDLIRNCWVKSVTGNGIDISAKTRCQVETCAVEDSTGTGIKIGSGASKDLIKQCLVSGNGSSGIVLSGTTITDNVFENCLIFNNTGYGIDIGTGVTRTVVRLNPTFTGNSIASSRDQGTGTYIETGGAVTAGDVTNIVNGVWDAVIASHLTAGSTGRTLRDAKAKATLASLK